MKRFILTVILTLSLSAIGFCQNTITFKGIPVTGSIDNFCKSLEQNGYETLGLSDNPYVYFGEFNGTEVFIMPQTMSGKVWRVMIMDYNTRNKTSIISRFNELLNQFINNPKYKHYSGDAISYDENIRHEILINDKQYSATFCLTDNTINGLVWFKIYQSSDDLNAYGILMFYENWDNKANGSDL